jgi:hypothetical protein
MFESVEFPHSYTWKRNTVSSWSGYDSEQRWKDHLRDNDARKKLELSGWLQPHPPIIYSYNSHAFRDDELNDRACGIALGCSYTEGVGVAHHQTWPAQLEQIVGFKVWNMGIGGTSIETCFRAMETWVPLLRPRFVAMLDPPIARMEICRADGGFTSLLTVGWENSDATSPNDQFVRHWFAQEFNADINHRKHVLAMRQLAQDLSVPFVSLFNGPICQPSPRYQEPRELIIDQARDLGHCGPRTLAKTAEIFHQKLREINAI